MQFLAVVALLGFVAYTSATSATITCTCKEAVSQAACDATQGVCSGCGTTTFTCSASGSGDCTGATQDLATSTCTPLCTAFGGLSSASISCSSSSSCFPAHATVQLENGSTKRMDQLAVSDRVHADVNSFSDVYMFSHKYASGNFTFVTLKTAQSTLSLTGDHYLYVNEKLAVASSVKVGDMLTTGSGKQTPVLAVGSTVAAGLFNPHTLTGDIVVDGIKTSIYTAAINPTLAHSALWPVRMAYKAGVDVSAASFNEGSDLIANVLPNGQKQY